MTPGGASGYPTTLESLSHVADSLHTRRGRCETGEKETLRISTDYAGFSAMLFLSPKASATKRYFLLSAHHLAFSVALLAQAHQQQA